MPSMSEAGEGSGTAKDPSAPAGCFAAAVTGRFRHGPTRTPGSTSPALSA